MTRNQVILIVACVALIGLIFVFGPRKPKSNEADVAAAPANTELFSGSSSFNEMEDEAVAQLSENQQNKFKEVNASLAKAKTVAEKVNLHNQQHTMWLAAFKPGLAAYHSQQVAELLQTDSAYALAGEHFVAAAKMVKDTALNERYYQNAINCYKSATNIAPNNIEHQIKLSLCYVEGTKQPMVGVSKLLEMVRENPDEPRVNLELGRLSILSGQFNKALPRLEKVIQQDTLQAEALFLLGETYNGLGQTEKAVEAFLECRTLVDNPAFRQEIDIYINKIKNI